MLIISGNHLVSRCPQGLGGGAALREELPAQKKGRPEATPKLSWEQSPATSQGGCSTSPSVQGVTKTVDPSGQPETWPQVACANTELPTLVLMQQAFLLCLPSFFLPLSKDRNAGWAWVALLVKCPDC